VRSYVERLTRPVVQRFIDEIKANLTTELFEPISVRCIGDAIGLTETSNDNLVEWFQAMALGLQNVSNDQAVWDRLDAALEDINNQLGALYHAALSKPNNTLMSHVMYGGMQEGKVRSLEEISPTMRVIILGGLQEPGHAAANACAGLLSNPSQGKVMVDDPSKHALRAFDEGLRWIAPIGVTPRVAAVDYEMPGQPSPQDPLWQSSWARQIAMKRVSKIQTSSTCSARRSNTSRSASDRISARVISCLGRWGRSHWRRPSGSSRTCVSIPTRS